MTRRLFFSMLFFLLPIFSYSQIVYVNQNANGLNNGNSWENAYTNLQDALITATIDTEIWVAQGTYLPTNNGLREVSFELSPNISLYGGFNGTETDLSERDFVLNPTILSGDLNGDDVVNVFESPLDLEISNNEENSYHVLTGIPSLEGTVTLDGFTICNGNASGSSGLPFQENRTDGGGLHFRVIGEGTKLTVNVNNCLFQYNSAVLNGGAIKGSAFNDAEYTLNLYNTDFLANRAGGIWQEIEAGRGGALANLVNIGKASISIRQCHFQQNYSEETGGAVHNNGNASINYDNCVFDRNYAELSGGACFEQLKDEENVDFTNCTFSANDADNSGGAIAYNVFEGIGALSIVNSVFSENFAPNGRNLSSYNNPLIEFNIGYSLFDDINLMALSEETPNIIDLGGNLYNSNPLFTDPANGDLSLQMESPAIDQGNNEFVTTDLDISGSTRIQNEVVDMGAYEFKGGTGQHFSEVSLRCFLEGSYNINAGGMNSFLQSSELLPNVHPYSNSPYNYTGEISPFDLNTVFFEVVDYVLVEARLGELSTTNQASTEVIETKIGLLKPNGDIVNLNDQALLFESLTEGEFYHFVIRHRNHLDIISQIPLESTQTVEYDFTIAVEQAAGVNQQKMSTDGKALLYAGDFTQDGVIQVTDYDLWNTNPASVNTYNLTDGTLDGVVQATDYDLWFLNKAKLGHIEIQY